MDRLDGMAAFAAAVEAGSLSGAAKRLGSSLASISRQISAIERQFGVTLLARTTRRLALTDEGTSTPSASSARWLTLSAHYPHRPRCPTGGCVSARQH